jgi:nitroreductase
MQPGRLIPGKGTGMEFFDAVKRRRSVRQYRDAPVGRDVLRQIVAAGVEAPSGCNLQLRQYVIVDDPAVMGRVRTFSTALQTAPAMIALLVEPEATEYGEFWVQDASAAMENMLLAAVALGYDACWVEGAIRRVEGELREILGVPDHLRVWSLVTVGEAAERPSRPPKPPADRITYLNRFGGR